MEPPPLLSATAGVRGRPNGLSFPCGHGWGDEPRPKTVVPKYEQSWTALRMRCGVGAPPRDTRAPRARRCAPRCPACQMNTVVPHAASAPCLRRDGSGGAGSAPHALAATGRFAAGHGGELHRDGRCEREHRPPHPMDPPPLTPHSTPRSRCAQRNAIPTRCARPHRDMHAQPTFRSAHFLDCGVST